ncbi:hypothetical protein ACFX13_037590 [Malus domestica]
MDLELEVGEADLVVRAVAIGAMNIGLLGEATRVVVREGFHELDGFRVLFDVGLIQRVSRWPDTEFSGGGELEVYDFLGGWRAAVGWECSTW